MGKLIRGKPDANEATSGTRGAFSLFVNGARYANAAAKFWSSIIDEVREDFPDCATIELSALSSAYLEKDLMYPQRALEKDLGRLAFGDMEAMMKETIAELEIMGPPSSVRIRLAGVKQEELHAGELPLDCIDTEIFPYLIVWPLAWADIPDTAWNGGRLEGGFSAEDRVRSLMYTVPFELTTKHISEGLFNRSFIVAPTVKAIA